LSGLELVHFQRMVAKMLNQNHCLFVTASQHMSHFERFMINNENNTFNNDIFVATMEKINFNESLVYYIESCGEFNKYTGSNIWFTFGSDNR
jgi:hypothetical protein